MPFLSRIWINPRRSQSQRFARDPQALHAAVLAGIPAQPVTERVLWRMDVDDARRPALLVLSESHPSWEHVVEQAGWPSAVSPDDPQVIVRSYEPLLQRLVPDAEFAFRLTANPVKSTRSREDRDREEAEGGGRARSVRHGQVTVDQQLSWLTSRAERFGFALGRSSASDAVGEPVPDLRIVRRERRSFRRKPKDQHRVTLQVVTYEGRLRVSDPDVLRERLLQGFGPAKAYGCGLMTLAPLA